MQSGRAVVHPSRRYRTISVLMAHPRRLTARGRRGAAGGRGCGVARRVSRRVVLRALTSPLDNGGRRPPRPVGPPRADLGSVSCRFSYDLVLSNTALPGVRGSECEIVLLYHGDSVYF